MGSIKNPDETLSENDKGDEVLRRYRYQAAYAALQSIYLLDENSEYEQIYCEQHEDVLIRLSDGKFVGIQVKTRDLAYGPFRFNHDAILHSLERFIEHEKRFPDKFVRYIICSNCGFSNTKDAYDLSYCVEVTKKNSRDLSACLKVVDFSKRIEKLSKAIGCDKDLVLLTLSKVETVTWANLEDYERKLAVEIGRLTKNECQSFRILQKIAKDLIKKTLEASSLVNDSKLTCYDWIKDPNAAKTASIILNKRISKEIVEEIFAKHLNSIGKLEGIEPYTIESMPTSFEGLELKMRKGVISEDDIVLMKDLDNSALKLFIDWYYEKGGKEANTRLEDLRLIVQHECQEAYNLTKTDSAPFGQEMLSMVRERLKARQEEIQKKYSECSYDHLEGIAGFLTEDCKVWWSRKFDVGEFK